MAHRLSQEGGRMFTALFFLIAFLSEIVGTVAGFGSSVFFVPLAGFFFDFHQVLALTSILHVFSNAAKLVFFGKHTRFRLLILIGLPSVAAVIAGAYLSTKLEFKFDELILGLFLIALGTFFFSKQVQKSPNQAKRHHCRRRCRISGWADRHGRSTSRACISGIRFGEGCVRRDLGWNRLRRRPKPDDHLSPQWLSYP
jgi:uncharacterized membrane protein YfcA